MPRQYYLSPKKTTEELPGSSQATELGRISESDTEITQQTQSVESTSSVVTEEFESKEKNLKIYVVNDEPSFFFYNVTINSTCCNII